MARISTVCELRAFSDDNRLSSEGDRTDHVDFYQENFCSEKLSKAFQHITAWSEFYQQVQVILGERLACLYGYTISKSSNCIQLSALFRKQITEWSDNPDKVSLSKEDQQVLDFGCAVARHNGNIANVVYNSIAKRFSEKEMIVLITFAAQLIALNVFHNVVETEIDETLSPYVPSVWKTSL
jgi:hypothetical protein